MFATVILGIHAQRNELLVFLFRKKSVHFLVDGNDKISHSTTNFPMAVAPSHGFFGKHKKCSSLFGRPGFGPIATPVPRMNDIKSLLIDKIVIRSGSQYQTTIR